MENIMEVPQKTKNRTTIWSRNFTPGYISGKNKNTNWKDTCILMFKAALFTIAKIWKQPKCPSTDEWIKKMWYYIYIIYIYVCIYTQWNISHKKGWNSAICSNVDGSGENIMLREINQTEKDKYCMLSLICGI